MPNTYPARALIQVPSLSLQKCGIATKSLIANLFMSLSQRNRGKGGKLKCIQIRLHPEHGKFQMNKCQTRLGYSWNTCEGFEEVGRLLPKRDKYGSEIISRQMEEGMKGNNVVHQDPVANA